MDFNKCGGALRIKNLQEHSPWKSNQSTPQAEDKTSLRFRKTVSQHASSEKIAKITSIKKHSPIGQKSEKSCIVKKPPPWVKQVCVAQRSPAQSFYLGCGWQSAQTLWEPACDIFVPRFRPKNSSFRMPYQRHSSSADCARELFKGSNGSASLLVCTRKKFFGWGLRIFCEWRHRWSSFKVILAHVAWPRAQPLGQSVSLKFSLETRLESESFEPLIDFLAFLVQKLWSKINKLIN